MMKLLALLVLAMLPASAIGDFSHDRPLLGAASLVCAAIVAVGIFRGSYDR